MCGVLPSGPLALLFFPVMIGASAVVRMSNGANSVKNKIKENNRRLDEGIKSKRQELKEEWTERILYRRQHRAEKSLVGKMKISDTLMFENETTSTQIVSSEDAILYLQRTVVRCSANKFEKALQDLKFAIYLDYTLKETYVVQYLEGFLLYSLGEYLESAHVFKRAIELKKKDDVKSIELEKKVFEIQNTMKHTSEKVRDNLNELHEQTKSYFKSAHKKFKTKLGMESQQEAIQENTRSNNIDIAQQHTSMIVLEELYFRAGTAYYFSTYYEDSIKCYTKAIEFGKSNPNIYHYIFNRGLSYFFSHEVDLALNDFLQAQSLMETDEVDKMISYTYGRKGMKKEQALFLQKAKTINPNTKLVTCFIYRLLDDNCTEYIFSFLPNPNRILLSRTCKHWREIAMKSIANEKVFKISLHSLFNDVDKQLRKVNTISLKEKLFLPSINKTHVMDIVELALGASVYKYVIEKPLKKIDCYMASPNDGGNFQYMTFGVNGLSFFKQVESLNIAHNSLRDQVLEVLLKESPDLKELTIRTGSYVYNDRSILEAIQKFNKLERLAWHFDFTSDSYGNILSELVLPPSLKIFEYAAECSDSVETILKPNYPSLQYIKVDNAVEYATRFIETFEDANP